MLASGHAGADRPLPAAGAARRAARRLRGHRGGGRLGSRRGIATTAERSDGGWLINGEKWFVTYGDVAAVYIVMANVVDGDDRLPTLFLVDRDAPGVEFVDDPPFTHTYPARAPDDPLHRRRGRATTT